MTPLHLFVFLIQTIPLLVFYVHKWSINLIHARSYPASLISYLVAPFFNVDYLFDMRGMYPEEGVIQGAFSHKSISYDLWKRLEKKLIKKSYCVIVESRPFEEYVREISPKNRVRIIPCYVDDRVFRFDETLKDTLRKSYSLNGKFVITYSGSMGGWHDPSLLCDSFLRIKRYVPNAHFLILTSKRCNEMLFDLLNDKGIAEREFTLLNPQTTDVPKYLLLGDVGLLIIANLPTAKKVLSIKFGEYLACGLPVIVSSSVEGAAQITEKYKCGIVIELDEEETFSRVQLLLKNYFELRENGINLVKSHLSLDKNYQKYLEAYSENFNV